MLPLPLSRALAVITLSLAAAVAAAGCAGSGAGGFGAAPKAGGTAHPDSGDKVRVIGPSARQPAPEVEGTTLTGEHLSLDSYRGKVVVLNFWASWCAPCRDEAPALQKVNRQARDEGVRVVGVNTKDTKANAKAFIRNYGLTYPSIYDQPGQVALAFRETVPPSALPATIVIDRQGKIAARIIGEASHSQLENVVTRVAGG